jgi:hypothetical protein
MEMEAANDNPRCPRSCPRNFSEAEYEERKRRWAEEAALREQETRDYRRYVSGDPDHNPNQY